MLFVTLPKSFPNLSGPILFRQFPLQTSLLLLLMCACLRKIQCSYSVLLLIMSVSGIDSAFSSWWSSCRHKHKH